MSSSWTARCYGWPRPIRPLQYPERSIYDQEIRERYRNRMWIVAASLLVCLIAFLVWFIVDRQRNLTRAKRSKSQLRNLHDRLRLEA